MVLTQRRRNAGLAIIGLIMAWPLVAEDVPVAVVLSGAGGTYRRPPDESELSLHPGEVLFAGDRINTGDPNGTTLLFCPAGLAVDLPKGVTADIGKNQARIQGSRRPSVRTLSPCELPAFSRRFNAANYHLGASLFGRPDAQAAIPAERPPGEREVADLLTRLYNAEKNRQESDALSVSNTLASYWPNAPQWKTRLFQHGETVAASKQPVLSGRGTWAIVIGISKYEGPQSSQLDYADRDAQMIYNYLVNPAGAAIPADHIRRLINGEATAAAVRTAFARIKSVRAERVVVFIASHGMEVANDAYIVATDTNPENAVATAISMREINDDLTSELAGVKTVIAWIDACHSGHVALNGLDAPPNGVLFGYAASEPRKPSYEDPRLGGGHGVFSYYLNEALTGGIPGRPNAKVYSLVDYVHDKVAGFTGHDQIPQKFGNIDQKMSLASLNLGDTGTPLTESQPGRLIARGFDSSDPLTEIENRGQQIILQYLEGDEAPVSRAEFADAESEFAAAIKLAPESLWLQAREAFCEGRVAIFDKQYDQAIQLLDKAIQLDPSDALAYNALGVLWLERADYTRALAAFDDAIRRAPQWAYPWHNRALAYTQAGDYSAAIHAYRHAMDLAPRYFYLPYNLGVLYQTLNRRKDAEASYRAAEMLDPARAEPYNALGALYASEGKRAKAEDNFRKALAIDPNFAVARENLVLLLR